MSPGERAPICSPLTRLPKHVPLLSTISQCFFSNAPLDVAQIQSLDLVDVNTSLRLSILLPHPPVNILQEQPGGSRRHILLQLSVVLDAAVIDTALYATILVIGGVVLVLVARRHAKALCRLVRNGIVLVACDKNGIEIGQVARPRGLEMADEGA